MSHTAYEQVKNVLENAKGNVLDVFYTLYHEYMESVEDPTAIFAQILQFDSPVGTEDAPSENIDDETRLQTQSVYSKLLMETVHILAQQNEPEEVFYQHLYASVFKSPLFPQDEKVRAVLLWLLSERIPLIPYFQAEGLLEQSNEEYKQAFGRVEDSLKQAVHMLNRQFPSHTEEASQLVRIADNIVDHNDRIVYWAVLIDIIRRALKKDEENGK